MTASDLAKLLVILICIAGTLAVPVYDIAHGGVDGIAWTIVIVIWWGAMIHAAAVGALREMPPR